MNYDKIILELLSRVQTLEEDVRELSMRNEEMKKDAIDEVITKTQARAKTMEEILKHYPNSTVEKANRAEGGGIKFYPAPNCEKAKIIKLYHSKAHDEGNSWHMVRLEDIDNNQIDYCIFSLFTLDNKWNYFIFTPNELYEYYEQNREEENDVLHLYFWVEENKAYETRENKIDVSKYLNAWDKLK